MILMKIKQELFEIKLEYFTMDYQKEYTDFTNLKFNLVDNTKENEFKRISKFHN